MPVDRVPEPEEVRKVATVLFADLVGSTALGAEQDGRVCAIQAAALDSAAIGRSTSAAVGRLRL